MTIALLAALIVVNAMFLVLLDRRDSRERAERAVLLQRIQAPEVAVYEHATREQPMTVESGMPMTDQAVAEEEAQRALERIAQLEQDEFDGRRL